MYQQSNGKSDQWVQFESLNRSRLQQQHSILKSSSMDSETSASRRKPTNLNMVKKLTDVKQITYCWDQVLTWVLAGINQLNQSYLNHLNFF